MAFSWVRCDSPGTGSARAAPIDGEVIVRNSQRKVDLVVAQLPLLFAALVAVGLLTVSVVLAGPAGSG